MAEEEDDDESFGDFTFASFPNQPLPSTASHANPVTDNDDDWGDFVNNSNQINGAISKPFDPFGASLDPSEKRANDNNGVAVQVEAAKKPKGAIPLSIFGEEEEEEEEKPASANVFSNKSNGVKSGSNSNGSVGISDFIPNLYNQNPHHGSVPVSNVAAPNPNGDGLVNSNASNLNPDWEDDDGWEFKTAESKSQNVQAEVPKHDNGAVDVGTVLSSSAGISGKAGGWNLEFDFSPSSASQNHITPQPGPKSEINDFGTGFTMFNQSFGDLNSVSGSNQNLEVPKTVDSYPTSLEAHKSDVAAPHGTVDSSLASESHQYDEWGFGFNFNSSFPCEDNHSSESYFKNKNNQDDNRKNSASLTNRDVDLFESKEVVAEIEIKQKNPLIGPGNRKEALPLSIFGDETPDIDEQSAPQDSSPYAPTSPMGNDFNSPGSNISINDLIWNLYNQAENKNSPNVTPKASENQIHAFSEISGSSLVTGGDDFDDEVWDFKDASNGTGFTHESTQRSSFVHAPQVNENKLQSSTTVLNSDLTNADDDFEDDSWEFKDAISGTRSQDQASTLNHQDLPPIHLSTKLEANDYEEFYRKLKDELCNCVLFQIQNLKVATISGDDAKAKALTEEIQEFSKALHQDNMIIAKEYLSEGYSPRNVNFDELLEVLKEPKFQPLDSEYQLASRLSMADKDMKSAMELLKEVVSAIRILKLGSREDQSNYLTFWFKIVLVCSQELKHGAYIWKQAVQKGVHEQILSNLQGAQYILGLGEIYRAAEIIGASAKLYKHWILSGALDPKSIFALLNECYGIWVASGLEEALLSISNQNNLESDDISRKLVESIKYIHELDEHALLNCNIYEEQTTCQLSALPAGFIPGLNLVTWNGKQYLVKLANLWINLISSDPPKK